MYRHRSRRQVLIGLFAFVLSVSVVCSDSVVTEDEEWVEIPRLERRSSRESGAGTSSTGGFGQRQDVHFRAFDRHFNLTLHPSPDLISPSFTIVVRRGESAQLDANASSGGRQIQNCLYRGRSTNGDQLIGTAAFDLCRGLRGIITTSVEEFYTVEPVKEHHRRKRRKRGSSTPVGRNWHVVRRIRSSLPHVMESRLHNSSAVLRWSREVRDRRDITVETAVFVDASLYNHMMRTQFQERTLEEMTHFVLAMINAVQLLYQDESLGARVRFQIQRLEMWTQQPLGLQLSSTVSHGTQPAGIHNIDHYLNRFCRWQSRENPVDDEDPLHWDHALLLTGLDLYAVGRDGFTSHQIVGLAPVGGMCTATSSCTVNEGRHFESVYVVAHEIGHNLGMKHDGRAAGNDCDPGSFLMSPTLGSGKTTWSPCSRNYLNTFLNTVQARCLRDRSSGPPTLEHNSTSTLPGQRFTADQQCMLRYGRDSRQAATRPINEICRDLHCTHNGHNVPPGTSTVAELRSQHRWVRQVTAPTQQQQALTSHPALEGTLCGHDMWCRRGRCVPTFHFAPNDEGAQSSKTTLDSLLAPSGDGSSNWTTVSDCRSGCLYGADDTLSGGSVGIATLIRTCPGQHTCPKVTVHYQACNPIQQCASLRKVTVQQYANQICQQAATHDQLLLPRGTQQVSSDAVRACQVLCYLKAGGLFTYGWTFPDGTRCQTGLKQAEHRTNFCLSGRCQEFDCKDQSGRQMHFESCSKTYEDVAVDHNSINSDNEPIKKSERPVQYSSFPERYTPHSPVLTTPIDYSDWSTPSGQRPNEITPNGIAIFDVPHAKLALVPKRDDSAKSDSSAQANVTWSPWEPVSPCRSGCLQSAQGLQLAQRTCRTGNCSGPATSVKLCTPTLQECPAVESVTDFAHRVCAEHLTINEDRESYRGIQMWPTADRPDDGCRVHCQRGRSSEIQMATATESGWFPSGTRCDHRRLAYCLSGRCVEFDQHGIPT